MSDSNPSLQLARCIIGELLSFGLGHIVLCPGSRSAPLAYAAAEAEEAGLIELHVVIDERSAGFMALGMAQGTGKPAAVVTTSGTAVANLLPAVMEAHHTDTPLVVLSADRPAKLQGTGANQTTSHNIFTEHTRAQLWVESADFSADLLSQRTVGTLLAMAGIDADQGTSLPPGPIQINFGFEEPLIPAAHEDGAAFFARYQQAETHQLATLQLMDANISLRGLQQKRSIIVAGHAAGPIAEAFARATGQPLLAEPSSNARFGSNSIAAYPALLPTTTFDSDLGKVSFEPIAEYDQIESVIVFGRPTLSRQISVLLNKPGIPKAMFVPEPVSWFEPAKRQEEIVTELQELARHAGYGPPGWLDSWQQAGLQAQQDIDAVAEATIGQRERISALRVAQVVWENTRGALYLGSSNSIREVDFASRSSFFPQARVYANRGLAGIDGTVSTAAGISLATEQTVTLLVGDLTFLHDVNALLAVTSERRPRLNIVVVNDHGGAIFGFLEHAEVAGREGMAQKVERLFGTPQNVDIAALCQAYAVDYKLLNNEHELMSALLQDPQGIKILEVPATRDQLAQRRREFYQSRRPGSTA